MTREELDELCATLRDATPAPWCEHPNGTSVWSGKEYNADDYSQRILFNAVSIGEVPRIVDDTAAIVALRNAAPALIEAARRGLELEAKLRAWMTDPAHFVTCEESWIQSDHVYIAAANELGSLVGDMVGYPIEDESEQYKVIGWRAPSNG